MLKRLFAVSLFSLVMHGGHAVAADLKGSAWNFAGEPGQGGRSISFDGSGRVTGYGGCNTFSGSYVLKGKTLRISQLVGTQRACAGDGMAKEEEFFAILGKISGFESDATSLRLLDAKGKVLVELVANTSAGN